MTVHFFTRFEPPPGREAELRQELPKVVEPTRAESGCVSARRFESLSGAAGVPWIAGLESGGFNKFAINERNGFAFRAEAYGFINHPNLSTINLNPNSSRFGEVTGKSNLESQLQLSLRYHRVSEPS